MAKSAQCQTEKHVARDPELSVLIPLVNSYSDIRNCLIRLRNQDVALEIVVVDRLGGEARAAVIRDFPEVIVVPATLDMTIPQMRAVGHSSVTAPFVAVIEDHVMVPPDWAKRMLEAIREDGGHDVVAGAFENAATGRLVDWAAFLCEYSSALPPLPSGPVDGVPGNNTIYRRETLEKYRDALESNQWENHLHDQMKADGVELIMRPDIIVGHKMHYTFWLYVTQRFHYSRAYAANRVRGQDLPKRLSMGATAFALPPILFKRTFDKVKANGQYDNELKRSLPMIGAFVTAWAAGEIAGYWFGTGSSYERVR
ncbi:MAG: glycosyltransferase family 2 protein [Silicimonas sp.]|nr:glycosyltransferase family 2 protein [Silicimonas sp.]